MQHGRGRSAQEMQHSRHADMVSAQTRRLLRGVTQRELAGLAQVSYSSVRQVEQGTRRPSAAPGGFEACGLDGPVSGRGRRRSRPPGRGRRASASVVRPGQSLV
ncbi:helix-turn-helix domain-containing protein [Kitasatospora sp. NPDC101801]|uniref:helix-turn-helix domain-containing protein n=1 Tax=Kitasatospora sp. NPDC101801 TaxID=3364103 RepID=UPI0038255712